MHYCPQCKTEVRADQKFCTKCGAKTSDIVEKSPDTCAAGPAVPLQNVSANRLQVSTGRKPLIVIVITAGITAALCCAFFFLVVKRTPGTTMPGVPGSPGAFAGRPDTDAYSSRAGAPSAPEPIQGYGDNPQPQRHAVMTTGEAEEIISAIYDASSRGDSEAFLNRFSDSVDYMGAGRVNRAFIRKESENYRKRWPMLTFRLEGEPALRQVPGRDVAVAENDVYFEVSDGEKSIQGRARDTWTFGNDKGVWRVVAYKQKVLSRNKYGF